MSVQAERDYVGWTKYVWLIYAVPFAVYPVASKAGPLTLALNAVATVAFLLLYFAGYRARGNKILPIIAALALLGVIFLPINLGAGAFFIYAASFAGTAGGMRRALSIVGIVL